MPDSCGSYLRMSDDNSKIAKTCNKWGRKYNDVFVGKWGIEYLDRHQVGLPENRLFDHSVFVSHCCHWVLDYNNRWECDDVGVGVSSGDFWKVFVR